MTHLSLYVQVTWQEARRICVSNSADLASITSEGERVFAWALAGGKESTWIGGNDLQTEGVWTWADGTPWSNPLWDQGQPDNYQGLQDCAILWAPANGLFDDDICTAKFKFICKGKGKIKTNILRY